MPRDLLRERKVAPKVGSSMLDCKYNRIIFLECRKVVALAVVETISTVCEDH